MYMTRSEAVDVLRRFVNTDILDQELADAVEEIKMILLHENEDNLSLWGAEDEASDLFVAKREDLIDEQWEQHCEELYDRYKIS